MTGGRAGGKEGGTGERFKVCGIRYIAGDRDFSRRKERRDKQAAYQDISNVETQKSPFCPSLPFVPSSLRPYSPHSDLTSRQFQPTLINPPRRIRGVLRYRCRGDDGGCCIGGAVLAGVDDGFVGGWGLGQACCREDEEGQGEGGEMHVFDRSGEEEGSEVEVFLWLGKKWVGLVWRVMGEKRKNGREGGRKEEGFYTKCANGQGSKEGFVNIEFASIVIVVEMPRFEFFP